MTTAIQSPSPPTPAPAGIQTTKVEGFPQRVPATSPSAPEGAAAIESRKRPEFVRPKDPVLRFTPTAWAKLLFFCHYGDTEIGGFGIAYPDDLLLIHDFQSVHQVVSSVTVAFDDVAVADFYEEQVDLGRKPQEFSRIWLHTHPGQSPSPSLTDEETFARVFGSCDWAVMAILAQGGKTYARLRFNSGPGGSMLIPVQVDYSQEFPGSDWEAWQEEYDLHVHPEPLVLGQKPAQEPSQRLCEQRQREEHDEEARDAHAWWERWEAGF